MKRGLTSRKRRPHVAVVGTRGFPGVVGGVETHCEHLYGRMGLSGDMRITVMRRAPYIGPAEAQKAFPGVDFVDINVPVWPAFEAWIHTLIGLIRARRMDADIVHIHSIGPALWAPFAKLLGMKVVATNHGADYERSRWGRFARFALRMGERMQVRFADEIISVGPAIRDMLMERYGRQSELIFNGVNIPESIDGDSFSRLWPQLQSGKYVLAAARHVPEKNLHLLVEAWKRLSLRNLTLVIAGDTSPATPYSVGLRRDAEAAGIVMPGYVRGEALTALMHHARLFVLPSAHEGLPITLLEAMSHGLDVLCSDIPANRLNDLTPDDFFPLGDDEESSIGSLKRALACKLSDPMPVRTYDLSSYDWARIADSTCRIYRRTLSLK